MEEEKIATDVSDKRKVEDDNINPKPNPKRIKLVRPVFSPVAKPSISTTSEINKSEVQTTHLPKLNIQLTEIPKCTTQSTEITKTFVQQSEIHKTNVKPTEIPKTAVQQTEIIKTNVKQTELSKFSNYSGSNVSTVVDVSQSTEKSVDRPEIIKTSSSPPETVKKSVVTLQVPDHQVDSSSDALDIRNIFSEETKKELEHLKKNIFKIDDDGSSSENDSQPKRPRLKRPTFVTSTVEVKVEPTDSKIFDKINETSRLEPVKSVIEENINITMEKPREKLLSDEEKIDHVTKNITEDIRLTQLGEVKIYVEDIFKRKHVAANVNRNEEEKSSTFKPVVKSTEVDNLHDVDKLKPIQTSTIVQENTDVKEIANLLAENKSIEKNNVNLTVEEQKCIKKEKLTEVKALSECTYEKVSDYNVMKESANDNYRVILERYVDKQCNIKAQEKNPSPIIVKLEDDKSIVETSYECTDKYNRSKNEINIESNILDKIKDKLFDSPLDNTQKDDKVPYLENKNLKSKKNIQIEDENKLTTHMLSNDVPDNDIKQNNEEIDSQMFKSDILKAALMSKKSPDSLGNSSEVYDQPSANEYPTVLETKENENLPKIGQDSIVNKIEAEIKLATNDQPTKIKKSQNKILSNVQDISKEASSSICLNENTTVSKHDEPPKWGSAKMNEVEKFLNDSNVTITPICKSQESPKLGKITLKLPKVGNPEIKSETTVRPDVKSELIKKITNKHIAMGDSPLKNALSQPSKSFSDFATIRPAPKLSAEQIALIEQQILNTPKKRGRPPKALAQQKQLLLEYQQQQQSKVQEGSTEDEPVFHVPLFDMEDMSGGAGMFDSFEASTPKRGKSIRGKGSRGKRGRGGRGGRGRDGSDSDTASNSRRIDDEGETFHEEMNQEEETKQVAMIEAERLRKEEERERKLEARKKKIKLRNDILKEKKMKKKQRAEERRLQWHEKKRLMQEEKARAAEMKKSLPPPQNFDDETRMSADCSLSQTTARNFILGEEDLSISGTTNDSIRMKKGRMEVIDLESNKTLTVDQIAEYQWPLDGGELYMIQEQISNLLGVKSFKRKYPGLKRRNVEAEERTFLCDSGLVAESLCDLGLTVLYSSEVLDIMYTDFPEKYEELREYMRLKHAKELSNRQRALMTISSNNDGSKLDLRDRAMEAVANWNINLNKSRLESRKCSMDMQTFIVHYPKNKCKKMAVSKPKIGSYPLALLPGQFCDYYSTYSSEDLRYLPMNTVMYGPLKSVDKDFPVSLSSQSESEDSSSDDSSDSDESIDVDNKSVKNCLEYGPSDKKGAECKLCFGTADKNKIGSVEPLIHCSKCLTIYHPTCLDMTLEMIPYIKRYNWQCNECKSCAQCKEVADEDKMLFCDLCDRGYHIYCVGLRRVPEGRWHCQECAMCSSCGVSDPGPGDSKWFYEFKKTEKTGSKVYCRTLCAPCSRSWKKGHFCPNCMRCYPIKNVERMTQCNSCDRYLHSECISESTSINQVVSCTICEEKAVSRLLTTVPRSLIKV